MTPSIDDLLTAARVTPTPASRTAAGAFDVGQALRRLARDVAWAKAAAERAGEQETRESEGARQRLRRIARWLLDKPDAADHLSRLVDDSAAGRQAAESAGEGAGGGTQQLSDLDIEGTVVFASLLYLTSHVESAQFWWQLAAGAGHRTAAYCLYLLHLQLGERRKSRHWFHEANQERPTRGKRVPPVEGLYELLEAFARLHRPATQQVPAHIEAEVDRLAADSCDGGRIVTRPDRRLAQRLHDATRR
ncbi:hypothetical protein [Streptomyces hoynatensis]|uniref:Sel1 repeat family protein n=1 Tax=Streptomyces hoynatensis TaxID=1141874 RepID=A0A3A9YR82_9ACTN|nr:hypothetical protein [Streptomyces hoynatensis]RKN38493.1 hypothetical protein D7294_23720 [Streptomyces hoynatensis]